MEEKITSRTNYIKYHTEVITAMRNTEKYLKSNVVSPLMMGVITGKSPNFVLSFPTVIINLLKKGVWDYNDYLGVDKYRFVMIKVSSSSLIEEGLVSSFYSTSLHKPITPLSPKERKNYTDTPKGRVNFTEYSGIAAMFYDLERVMVNFSDIYNPSGIYDITREKEIAVVHYEICKRLLTNVMYHKVCLCFYSMFLEEKIYYAVEIVNGIAKTKGTTNKEFCLPTEGKIF